MSLLLATMVVAVFALVLERLRLPDRARQVGDRAMESLRVLRDPTMDDRAKETALQDHAVGLFGLLGILVGGSLVALGLPLLAVWLLELGGLVSLGAVLDVLGRVEFLVAASAIGATAYLLSRRARRP